jgi:hypothetical protein
MSKHTSDSFYFGLVMIVIVSLILPLIFIDVSYSGTKSFEQKANIHSCLVSNGYSAIDAHRDLNQ